MKTSSTQPFPTQPQRWKEGQQVVYFNQTQEQGDDGTIYNVEFTIIRNIDELEHALLRHFCDPELEQKVIDNIQINGQNPIEIIKNYEPSEDIINMVLDVKSELLQTL